MQPALLKIRLYGDPALRKKSLALKEAGPGERYLIESMILTMHQSKGVGLAAPQVGINQRIIVVDVGEGPRVLVNPKVLKKSGSAVMEEGCLSIPGVTVAIKRPEKILVEYLDENNRSSRKSFLDLLARVILHEIDHLQGKLIIDYLNVKEKFKLRKQLKEIKNR